MEKVAALLALLLAAAVLAGCGDDEATATATVDPDGTLRF
jgi:ABC-type glycerol-3-phosphate transport system substrate-binding protein